MPELHSNGVYENYIAQLFNPLSNLSQTNPAAFNSGFAGAGIPGMVNPALANIVFFDAPSKEEALEIARIHPGLHYGVTVEVREWDRPRPPVATQ